MSTILVWREQLQKLYAKYSSYITRVLQFFLGVFVFGMINSNIGFLKSASSAVCTIGLSVVCAFLPLTVLTFAATVLVLVHLYTLSMGVAIVTALFFVLMYIFYLRLAPKHGCLIIIAAVAFAIKMPFVIIVAVGLLGTPAYLVSIICGTFSYYMLHTVKTNSGALKSESASEMIRVMTKFIKQLFANKEMLLMIAIVVVCVLLVYGIRTRSMDHAWKIASVTGTVVAIVICIMGDVMANIHISYATLFIDAAVTILIGLLLEIMFLSVDYNRTEHLEFEDDEYHYYVKAVPKLAVSAPEKNVKQITGQQDSKETEENGQKRKNGKNLTKEKSYTKNERAEDILLTRSLNKELGIEDLTKNK